MRISPAEASTLAERQSKDFSSAVTSSVADHATEDIFEIAKTLHPTPAFIDYADTRFLWEMLDMGKDTEILRRVKEFVSTWVQEDDNIKHVVKCVRRCSYAPEDLVSGFALFRMKPRDGPDWVIVEDHGWPDYTDPDELMPQSVIFIALSKLSWDNGFFMDLEKGDSVCLDAKAKLLYPPTGGGLGIAFWLRL